jgi:metal-sulfur cluster biosynthetic enzyme
MTATSIHSRVHERATTGDLRARIDNHLNAIGDPCSVANGSPLGLVDMGIVDEVDVDAGGVAHVALRLTSPSCYVVSYFADEIRKRVGSEPEITAVTVTTDLGLDWTPDMMSEHGKAVRRRSLSAIGLRPRVGLGLPAPRDGASG